MRVDDCQPLSVSVDASKRFRYDIREGERGKERMVICFFLYLDKHMWVRDIEQVCVRVCAREFVEL